MMVVQPDLTDVLELYGVHVTGLHGNRQILCPVVDESVPSCSVNLDKGLLNCFGCGFQGDAYTLIMTKEGIDFAAALEFAATHLGVARQSASHAGRVGLSGSAGAARGGWKPAYRRRPGLTGA